MSEAIKHPLNETIDQSKKAEIMKQFESRLSVLNAYLDATNFDTENVKGFKASLLDEVKLVPDKVKVSELKFYNNYVKDEIKKDLKAAKTPQELDDVKRTINYYFAKIGRKYKIQFGKELRTTPETKELKELKKMVMGGIEAKLKQLFNKAVKKLGVFSDQLSSLKYIIAHIKEDYYLSIKYQAPTKASLKSYAQQFIDRDVKYLEDKLK